MKCARKESSLVEALIFYLSLMIVYTLHSCLVQRFAMSHLIAIYTLKQIFQQLCSSPENKRNLRGTSMPNRCSITLKSCTEKMHRDFGSPVLDINRRRERIVVTIQKRNKIYHTPFPVDHLHEGHCYALSGCSSKFLITQKKLFS